MPSPPLLAVETPFHVDASSTSALSPSPTAADHIRRPPAKRRRVRRQQIVDQSAVNKAVTQCEVFASNDHYSCFPTEDTVVVQGQYVSFVWNSRRPELTQQNKVNVYMYRADSMTQLLAAEDLDNDPQQAGVYRAQANDSWWGDEGPSYSGVNTTYPFYWVITPASKGLDGSQSTQSVFSAIQTTYPSSVLLAMSSSSAAAVASASSASATRSSSSPTSTASGGSVMASGNDSFPHWAIAVIVVLGFLAIAALCVLAFIILRRSRRRSVSTRSSMGSSTPMMTQADNRGVNSGSPLLAAAVLSSPTTESASGADHDHTVASMHDGASTISRAQSTTDAPFSGADAALMADAFRKALRKPDFAGRPVEEGDSPPEEPKEELINRELAEEGRDIRSVSSSRRIKVEPASTDEH